jgi:two-component system, NtrC family, sensor kinase
MDQFFSRQKVDYRKTLVEFGRELSSETDMDKMLTAVVDRLSRTLMVVRVAVFLADERAPGGFVMAKSAGMGDLLGLDLNFLSAPRPGEHGHLFFDNTHQALRETPRAQETISRLDLNYYIPCTVQQSAVAVLGLGKTMEGDFLTSEDVELLETLAGYIGIAIQNARLYASLEQKVQQYERLKDFNENIVESISVGVLAVDLDDRIEFWNSQMEVMYALPRSEAVGKPLAEVFPAAFTEEFYRLRQSGGIHNLYKFRLGTRTGESRVANIAIAPLVTRRFNVIGRLIILDDITERIELESQLTQAEKLSSIGLMAAGVAHEVNTPLAVISSYAQMLSKQLQGDEKKSSLLEKITAQSFRASEIVNNLLNFSRTSGSELAPLDLNRVLDDTLQLLEIQLRKSEGAHPHRAGTRSRAAAHPRQRRQVAAGVPQPVPERKRRDAQRRHAQRQHHQRFGRERARARHRRRHRAGAHEPHLRSVFHHQARAPQQRPGTRHRARARGYIRHHPGARRQNPCGEPRWGRHHLPPGISSDKEGCECLELLPLRRCAARRPSTRARAPAQF